MTSAILHARRLAFKNGKTAFVAVLPNSVGLLQAATTCVFRFLRQPSRPNAPRPVAKSGPGDLSRPDITARLESPNFSGA
jgi:hypothetical protein